MLHGLILSPPVGPFEWDAFHDIRKTVLFDARGRGDVYDRDHPDDRHPDHTPLLLRSAIGRCVGVLRIDLIDEHRAGIRLVAIAPDLQRGGLGRAMIDMAMRRIAAAGRREIVVISAPDAVPFYVKLGFEPVDGTSNSGAGDPVPLYRPTPSFADA